MAALYVYGQYISWTGIIVALACAAAIVVGAILRRFQGRDVNAFLLCSVLGCLLGSICSRAVYWYCSSEEYTSFWEIFTSVDSGQSLGGAMLGAALAVVITGLFLGAKELPALFDCACTAGALAIFTGRLAGFTNSGDRGRIIFESPILQRFPFAVRLVTGNVSEWRFASFFYESLAALLIFFACAFMFIRVYEVKREPSGKGCVALLFCAMFGSSQAVLESTRYDSIFLRFNGFVSFMQILGALMVLGALIAAAVLAGRSARSTAKALLPVVIGALLVAFAGGMEYLVQRYAKYYPFWYLGMGLALGCVCFITWRLLEKRLILFSD